MMNRLQRIIWLNSWNNIGREPKINREIGVAIGWGQHSASGAMKTVNPNWHEAEIENGQFELREIYSLHSTALCLVRPQIDEHYESACGTESIAIKQAREHNIQQHLSAHTTRQEPAATI